MSNFFRSSYLEKRKKEGSGKAADEDFSLFLREYMERGEKKVQGAEEEEEQGKKKGETSGSSSTLAEEEVQVLVLPQLLNHI